MPINGKDFPIPALSGLNTLEAYRNLNTGKAKLAQNTVAGPGVAKDAKSSSKADSPGEAEKAATDFEALLLHQMLQAMWSTVPSEGMLGGSREEDLYRDMLNDALSKQIAEGQSIGIKEVVLRDLNKAEKK